MKLTAAAVATLAALAITGCTSTDDPVAAGDCVIPTVSLHFGEDNPHLADMFDNPSMGTSGDVIEWHDEPSESSPPYCQPSVTWEVPEDDQ